MVDYSELRRLRESLTAWPNKLDPIIRALPGLLDENDRLRAHDPDAINIALSNRIVQLEAAIQELIEGGSMDEKDMLLAYAALEGKSAK